MIGVTRSLESELTGLADSLGRMNNEESMRYLNLYASPSFEYKKGNFDARLNFPFSFIPFRYIDKVANMQQNEEKFFLSPRLFLQYKFSQRLSASLSGSYVQTPLQEQSFHEGLILNNYRNISRGLRDFDSGNSKSVSFTIRNQNPLKVFFWNASISRVWSYSTNIAGLYFFDPFLLNTLIKEEYNHSMWLVSGNISKGLDAINGMVSLRSTFSAFDGAMIQNGIKSPYTTQLWSFSPKITNRINRWFNTSYEFSISYNLMNAKTTGMQTSSQNFVQKISGNISSGKKWLVRVSGEHYYNEITARQSKHFILADAEVTYVLRSGLEFNLSLRNAFNQNVYAYNAIGGLMTMSKEYIIRPRNLLASVFFRF